MFPVSVSGNGKETDVESLRDVKRAMEREVKKGSCPLMFDRLEFGSKPFQTITSEEKLDEVLAYLLRVKTFRQYAEKTMLIDRMELSLKSGWIDEQGRIYLYFTIDEIQERFHCASGKAVRLLAELDSAKGIGLIETVRQGLGKSNIIYVKNFVKDTDPPEKGR